MELNETVDMTLSNAVNASILDGSGLGTITNDDAAPTPPSVSIADATVTEGNTGTPSPCGREATRYGGRRGTRQCAERSVEEAQNNTGQGINDTYPR